MNEKHNVKVNCPTCGKIGTYDPVSNKVQMRVCVHCRHAFYLGAIYVAGSSPEALVSAMTTLMVDRLQGLTQAQVAASLFPEDKEDGIIDD